MARSPAPTPSDTPQLIVVRSLAGLRARIAAWRQKGERVALVPTMGALHDGHLSLVRMARMQAERVVVSVFVNPRQFGPREDLSTYPRDEAGDASKLNTAGADVMYAPTIDDMYPAGFATTVRLSGLTDCLCGAVRPNHFDGVATIVTKLFMQTQADVAVFGEKDFQQLAVIRRMVRDLELPIEVLSGPTLRESDGLAMSSRNTYLSADERAVAGKLNGLLKSAAEKLARGDLIEAILPTTFNKIIAAGFATLDYLEVRRSADLALLDGGSVAAESRLFVAGWVGKTRLIDNWVITPKGR